MLIGRKYLNEGFQLVVEVFNIYILIFRWIQLVIILEAWNWEILQQVNQLVYRFDRISGRKNYVPEDF